MGDRWERESIRLGFRDERVVKGVFDRRLA